MLWKDLNGYRNWRPTHLSFTLGNTIQDIRSGGLQDEDIALEAWEMAFGLNLCWPSLLKACWNASPANGACSTESTRHNFLVYPHVAFSSRLSCVCGSRWTFVYLIRFVLLFFLFFFLFGRHLNRQGICFRCLYCCTYFCLSESHKSMAGEQKPSTDNFYAWHIDTISGGSVDALSTFISTCPKCQSLLAGVIRSKCWESTWNGPPFARRLPRSQHK